MFEIMEELNNIGITKHLCMRFKARLYSKMICNNRTPIVLQFKKNCTVPLENTFLCEAGYEAYNRSKQNDGRRRNCGV